MTTQDDASRPLASALQDAQTFCKRTWWMFLVGGIASVIFGVLAFINPAAALLVLAIYFAAFVIVDGVANVVGSIMNRDKDGWWLMLLFGIVGIFVGGYALLNPEISITALLMLAAVIASVVGVSMLALGWRVRQASDKEWILYALGVVSLLFSVLMFARPVEGAESLVWMIASWAVLTGALRIWFAFKIKNIKSNVADRIRGASQETP